MACKEGPDPGQLFSTAILGSVWEDPSFPAPGSHLTPLGCTGTPPILCTPCLAPRASCPACLGSEPAVWQEQLCCSPGSSASPRHQAWPRADPTCARGSAEGHEGCRGSAGRCRCRGQGAWAPRRGLGKAGQTKGSQTPRGRLGSEPVPEC